MKLTKQDLSLILNALGVTLHQDIQTIAALNQALISTRNNEEAIRDGIKHWSERRDHTIALRTKIQHLMYQEETKEIETEDR